jgi:glucose/arabinose dehydrogenase
VTARIAAALSAFALVGGAAALAAPERSTAPRLVRVLAGLTRPVFVTAAPGEPRRLYVVEQAGVIRIVDRGKLLRAPFVDLRRLVGSDSNEQGLLGLAFDPGYAKNHRFYVDYTDKKGDTNVAVLVSSKGRAVARSLRRLLFVDQPYDNHNGGMLAFGPDRQLYVGLGDGGSGGDPENRAQDPNSQLGKLLRIDVRHGNAVSMAALGLRNAWRFSFDRATSDLYIGDVGQDTTEEVDYVRAGWTGLLNFGWRVYEGSSKFKDGPLGPGTLVAPIAQYTHADGCSVTGGYVYRGRAVPEAVGRYYYGDFCSGHVWSLAVTGGVASAPTAEGFTVPSLSSFGQDAAGELYLVSLDGVVYRLAA